MIRPPIQVPRRCATFAVALLVVLAASWVDAGQAAREPARRTGFVPKVHRDAEGQPHRYQVFVPHDYTPERPWPVILFLHGAGERGTEGVRQTMVGLGPYVRAHEESFPYLAVFPQADEPWTRIKRAWSLDAPDGRRALAILEQVERDYAVDPERRILTGWSMGGYGAWDMGAARPERWAAVVPISGGGDPDAVKPLVDVPVWAFQGANDVVVPPEESRRMVAALRKAGGEPRYSEIRRTGHAAWQVAYASPSLWSWLEQPTVGDPRGVAEAIAPGPNLHEEFEVPFVPVAEVPRTVAIRVGNDVLDAVSYAVPGEVPPNALRGGIGTVRDRASVGPFTFDVAFAGIGYRAEVERAFLRGHEDDLLAVHIGLRNVRLSLGRTYVKGDWHHSAVAGPMSVVIGHRRPVWLSVLVSPYVEDRRLRLRHVSSDFTIERDNWYVTAPAGVSTEGLFMSGDRVRRELVRGVYGSRRRLERQVESIVPDLVARLEEALDVEPAADLLDAFWPLPTYRPQTRLWPEAVAVDEDGLSLVLGMTVAAINPAAVPAEPRRLEPLGPAAEELTHAPGLLAGIAPGFLRPLTRAVAEADIGRVHVLDLPQTEFARYVERPFLERVLPETKRFGPDAEFAAELVLGGPLSVEDPGVGDADPDGSARDAKSFAFDVPRLQIQVAVKPLPDEAFRPYAVFDHDVHQRVGVNLLRPDFVTRGVRMAWLGDAEIDTTVGFAESYDPEDETVNPAPAAEQFRAGWEAFTGERGSVESRIPDLELGTTTLRLDDTGWRDGVFALHFDVPGIRVTNDADVPLAYETKGPFSTWGGPYTLPPGEFHDFSVAYPILYRDRTTGRLREYTLPAGSHSIFVPGPDGEPGRLVQAPREGL